MKDIAVKLTSRLKEAITTFCKDVEDYESDTFSAAIEGVGRTEALNILAMMIEELTDNLDGCILSDHLNAFRAEEDEF